MHCDLALPLLKVDFPFSSEISFLQKETERQGLIFQHHVLLRCIQSFSLGCVRSSSVSLGSSQANALEPFPFPKPKQIQFSSE